MFMIPDNILETLICRNCKNYLSARPVKVYPNRHVCCGRCSSENDGGVISIYDAVAQQGLFKCINRYEGCDKILKYTEVLEHEKTCTSRTYRCLCTTTTFGLLPFMNHFKEMHKNSILNAPSFEILNSGRNFTKQYLYVLNHVIFLINFMIFRTVDHTKVISFHAVHLGSHSDKIFQKYILYTQNNGKKENRHVTKRKLCSSNVLVPRNRIVVVNYGIEFNQTLLVEFELDTRNAQKLLAMPISEDIGVSSSFNSTPVLSAPGCSQVKTSKVKKQFFMTDEFQRMWSSKYHIESDGISNLSRKISFCCYCENLFLDQSETQSIYKCNCAQCSSSNNLICSKCYFFGITMCVNGNGKPYQFAPEETTMFKTVKYNCHWGCGERFYSWNLKTHEFNCQHQSETLCPIKACNKTFSGAALIKHIEEHPDVIFQLDNLISTTVFSDNDKGCLVVPIMNYFVTLTWDKILLKTFSCSLFNVKNRILKNLCPKACFRRNYKVVSYTNIFTVDIEVDQNILLILVSGQVENAFYSNLLHLPGSC